jgi:hypothetical protein
VTDYNNLDIPTLSDCHYKDPYWNSGKSQEVGLQEGSDSLLEDLEEAVNRRQTTTI